MAGSWVLDILGLLNVFHKSDLFISGGIQCRTTPQKNKEGYAKDIPACLKPIVDEEFWQDQCHLTVYYKTV